MVDAIELAVCGRHIRINYLLIVIVAIEYAIRRLWSAHSDMPNVAGTIECVMCRLWSAQSMIPRTMCSNYGLFECADCGRHILMFLRQSANSNVLFADCGRQIKICYVPTVVCAVKCAICRFASAQIKVLCADCGRQIKICYVLTVVCTVKCAIYRFASAQLKFLCADCGRLNRMCRLLSAHSNLLCIDYYGCL